VPTLLRQDSRAVLNRRTSSVGQKSSVSSRKTSLNSPCCADSVPKGCYSPSYSSLMSPVFQEIFLGKQEVCRTLSLTSPKPGKCLAKLSPLSSDPQLSIPHPHRHSELDSCSPENEKLACSRHLLSYHHHHHRHEQLFNNQMQTEARFLPDTFTLQLASIDRNPVAPPSSLERIPGSQLVDLACPGEVLHDPAGQDQNSSTVYAAVLLPDGLTTCNEVQAAAARAVNESTPAKIRRDKMTLPRLVVHEPAVEQYPPTHQGASQTLHGSTDNEPSLDIDQSPVK